MVRRAVAAESSVATALKTLAARGFARPSRTSGLPLWAVVSQLFALGCSSATELCTKHGLDPNQRVRGL